MLNIGDKVHYRSLSMIHPEATYEGIVTEEYKNYYRVLGTPLRHTINVNNKREFWGPATPYYFCIPKYIDVDCERVKIVNDTTEQLSA